MTVHLGSSLGITDFGSLAIDGTKIQAYTSLYETYLHTFREKLDIVTFSKGGYQ